MTLRQAASIVYAGLPEKVQPSILKSHPGATAGHGGTNDDASQAVLSVDFTSPEAMAREQAAYERCDWVAPEYASQHNLE